MSVKKEKKGKRKAGAGERKTEKMIGKNPKEEKKALPEVQTCRSCLQEADLMNIADSPKSSAKEPLFSSAEKKILALATLIVFVFFMFNAYQTYKNKAIMEECRAIQDSPELRFPCVCYPATEEDFIQSGQYDILRGRVDIEACKCVCTLEDNSTWSMLIPHSKAYYDIKQVQQPGAGMRAPSDSGFTELKVKNGENSPGAGGSIPASVEGMLEPQESGESNDAEAEQESGEAANQSPGAQK